MTTLPKRQRKQTFFSRTWQAAKRLKAFIFSTFPTVSSYFIGLASSWTRPSYQKLAEKVMRNPYAHTAFVLIASNLASIAKDVQVRQPGADGVMEDVPDHPLKKLLMNPNKDQSTISFFKEMMAHLFFGGVAIIWNLGAMGRFAPTSLRLQRPDRMQQVDRSEETLEITQHKGVDMVGRPITLPADEVLYIVNYNPLDDNIGLPLAMPILQALDLFDNLLGWANSISQHKGRIPGWFKVQEELTDGPYKRLRDNLQKTYKSDSKDSVPMLLEGGIEWEGAAISPENAQLRDQLISLVRMIAVGMGIDPALLGDNANKTYSNFQEAVRALIQLKVLPLLNWILDEMNNWYMPRYGTPEAVLFIDESTIKQLREDLNEKMKRLVDGVAGTIITPDEARTELGNDEIGGTAASLLAKVGTVRLEDIGLSFGLEEGDEEGAEKFLMAIHEQLKKNSNGKVKT